VVCWADHARCPRPPRVALTAIAASDRLGIPGHVMQVARGGTGGTPIQPRTAMLRAERHEGEAPLAPKVGRGIALETPRTV